MNTINAYWMIVILLSALLALLSMREFLLLARLPPAHPDRGSYWFNVCLLILASGGLLYGGHYIDIGRRTFEALIAIPPSSRYAIERNAIIHDATWVYESGEREDEIRSFYREYARAQHVTFLEDDHDAVRMSFALPSGLLFLTLHTEGKKTILYFSRVGEIRIVTP